MIILPEELNVKRNVYDIIEAFMKYKSHHLEIIKEVYDSQFDDYRDIDEDEMNNHINKNLGEIPIHKLLQELSINDFLWDFGAVSLNSSATSDEMSIYPRIEFGYAFTKDINIDLVEKFIIQTFTRGSAILKIKYYNPKNLIVQHLPVKEKEKKFENNRMRNG